MPKIDVHLEAAIRRTFRVDKVAGTFDVPLADKSRLALSVHVPPIDGPGSAWRVGVIVGPSGAGKSQVARQAYGDAFVEPDQGEWPRDAALVDGFAADLDMREITGTLSAVGFSSPPAWVLPYGALSTGPWCWKLAGAWPYAAPVPATGKLSFWEWTTSRSAVV